MTNLTSLRRVDFPITEKILLNIYVIRKSTENQFLVLISKRFNLILVVNEF